MCCKCCESISDNCCKNGLKAIKSSDKGNFNFNNSRNINCSIDIDKCFENTYPNAPRWDYFICYQDKAYFVEIHPANSGEKVKEILKKFDWLKNNILNKASCRISKIHIYWIATGKVAISKRSRYGKQLEAKRIKLVSLLSV